jgi:nicotinate-nucleotide pyrophosphorylase (carboxylating)
MDFLQASMQKDLEKFFAEDEIHGNFYYLSSLPTEEVECLLKIKSDVILTGLPYFIGTFNFLGAKLSTVEFEELEGKSFTAGKIIKFKLPFNIAISGERIALNLLQRSTSISTHTKKFVEIAAEKKIKILDTRKTTPGLRHLEKYAVRMGGAYNHRMSQTDVFMIKDNHKTFFGSLKKAYDFFISMHSFYNSIVVEIHSIDELKEAISLGIKHVMLDNFEPKLIEAAIRLKTPGMTYELSGGIKYENIKDFLITGVDVISLGTLTYGAPHVDLSMKIKKLGLYEC